MLVASGDRAPLEHSLAYIFNEVKIFQWNPAKCGTCAFAQTFETNNCWLILVTIASDRPIGENAPLGSYSQKWAT